MNPGKLIVFEGIDGSGKTTQAKLLLAYFKKQNLPFKYFNFPQYETFYGQMIARFLRGEFGRINKISPYLASLLYTLDRTLVSQKIKNFLKKGGYVIANRYTTSNLAHQTAKISDEKEKEKFLKWLTELEYKIHNLPKEDLVLYLFVPWQTTVNLKNGSDMAEKDIGHRIASEKMYLCLVKKFSHWVKIDCYQNGRLLSPQTIHQKILDVLRNKKYLI